MQSKREPKSGCASAQDKEWWLLKKQPFHPGCPQVRWGSPQRVVAVKKAAIPPRMPPSTLGFPPSWGFSFGLHYGIPTPCSTSTATRSAKGNCAPGPRLANKSTAWSMQSALGKILAG